MNNQISKILIIGGGADEISHETEIDSAIFQVATHLKQQGYQTILIDNNPFSFSLGNKQAIDQSCILPLTIKNLLSVIHEYHPDAILPNLGGINSLRLVEELLETGILNEQHIKILGVPEATIRQLNNPVLLNQTMKQMQAPIITAQSVNSFESAVELTRSTGFPVIVKPVAPQGSLTRRTCHDTNELADAINIALGQSRVGQAMVQQSIAGYKEIEVVVLRDRLGTMLQVAGIEDFDPIGIHAGDSIAFIPTQTLLDREYQRIRDVALAITRKLRIVGINHVQFALNPSTGEFYVIKNSPYFDRMTSFAAKATGYPLAEVCASLLAGKVLPEIILDSNYSYRSALIEPSMDHIAARIPIWPFDILPDSNQRLGTQMRSTGSTMGIGRSTEEALIKAMRAAHFHSDTFRMEENAQLSDDEIVQRLIHPRANRIVLLIEALHRGYSTSELAELTKIDPYYFYKLKKVQQLHSEVAASPRDIDTLRKAKYYGYSDRMIGKLWDVEETEVTQLRDEQQIYPVYKEVDPSAGEFEQHTTIFYSTFEEETELVSGDHKKALIIGAGGFRLGNAGAAEYYTAAMLQTLKKQGYETILINNNPSAVSMNQILSDKIYVEPVETTDILAIARAEKPDVIYIPKIRQRLCSELEKYNLPIVQLPQNGRLHSHLSNGPEFCYNALFDGQKVYPLGISSYLIQSPSGFGEPTAMVYPAQLSENDQNEINSNGEDHVSQQKEPGIYQTLFVKTNRLRVEQTRVIPLTEISFLSKVLHADLVQAAIRLSDHTFVFDEFNEQVTLPSSTQTAAYAATFPFQALHLFGETIQSTNVLGAEMALGTGVTDALKRLNVNGQFQFHDGSFT